MKIKLRVLSIVMFAAYCISLGSSLDVHSNKYEALLGKWDVQTEEGSYSFIFEFYMEDDDLAGKYTGTAGETRMENLSFEDNQLEFSVNVNEMTINFSAKIDGENLEGMLSLPYGETNIKGVRRKNRRTPNGHNQKS